MLLLSIAMLRQYRVLAATGIVAFVVSSVALSLSICAQFDRPDLLPGLGVGAMERLAAYPANLRSRRSGLAAQIFRQAMSPKPDFGRRSDGAIDPQLFHASSDSAHGT